MPPSQFKVRQINDLKEKAFTLYKEGLSTREVAKIVGRSHTWVAKEMRKWIKKLSTGK